MIEMLNREDFQFFFQLILLAAEVVILIVSCMLEKKVRDTIEEF